MTKKLDKVFAPLANVLCELSDSPEMEADFKRWERNAIIEEYARAVENFHNIAYDPAVRKAFAAAIRALKDRPK